MQQHLGCPCLHACGKAASWLRVDNHISTPDPSPTFLSLGADGVMVPLVNTLEQAKAAVSYCLYTPRGVRSAVYPSRCMHG